MLRENAELIAATVLDYTYHDLRATLGMIFYAFLNFIIGSNESFGVNIPESDYGKLQSLADMLNYLSERVDKTVLFLEFLFQSKALCLPCFPFYETLLSKYYL